MGNLDEAVIKQTEAKWPPNPKSESMPLNEANYLPSTGRRRLELRSSFRK